MSAINAQSIFDVVSEHLLRQNMRCIDPKTLMVTWKFEHLSCAVGVLFPTTMPDSARSYSTVKALVLHYKEMAHYMSYVDLLVALQNVHDQFPALWWPAKLRAVADRFGLAKTVLPKE